MHDSIIILCFHLVYILFIHIRPWMAAQQSILLNISELFCPSLRYLRCMICGSFHNKATIHASALQCVLKTWTETVLTCLTKIAEQQCSHPDPILTINVPYERKINMLSYTDKNFMIFLFNFGRFRIKVWFPFFNSHCIVNVHNFLMIMKNQ